LDRHASYEDYVAAKLRISANQGNDDLAVVSDDLGIEDIGGCARRVPFGSGPEAELADRADHLWWDGRPLVRHDQISLPGEHNRQNAMATAAVCLARGIDPDTVAAGLWSFRGVPHRLEVIGSEDDLVWINDSKATNVQSTLVALAAFASRVHLIAGGRSKGQDFSALAGPVRKRCAAV